MRDYSWHKAICFIGLYLLCVTSLKAQHNDPLTRVSLRAIADEFLLQLGDSTSRILPVEQEVDGRYVIRFENEFPYEPDMLVFASFKILESSPDLKGYIVEVEECSTKDVIHTFEVNPAKGDNLVPCRRRGLEEGCFVFYFTPVEMNIASISSPASTSAEMEGQDDPIWKYLIGIGVLSLMVFLFLFFRKRRRTSSVADQQKGVAIGLFDFDKHRMQLLLKEQTIPLSGKESELLDLLQSHESQTLEREILLKKVWGDEGDYIGRTLDVFVSKLRKKLEADPNVKIINVRGVGYRLVVHDG